MVAVATHLDRMQQGSDTAFSMVLVVDAVRWVVAPTVIVAAAGVTLEVEFAGGNPADETGEDGVHCDCRGRGHGMVRSVMVVR